MEESDLFPKRIYSIKKEGKNMSKRHAILEGEAENVNNADAGDNSIDLDQFLV